MSNETDKLMTDEFKEHVKLVKENDKEPMTKGHWILKAIDWTLLAILIGLVIYAQIDGKFISKEIIEICNGVPVNQLWNQTTQIILPN